MITKEQIPEMLIREAKDIVSGFYFMAPIDDYKARLTHLEKEVEDKLNEITELKATIKNRETLKEEMVAFLKSIGESI